MVHAGHRRHIPEPVKEMLITMSCQMSSKDIAKATNTGRSTVNRILRLYKETGSVVKKPEVMGRPRKLNSLDIAVCIYLIQVCIVIIPLSVPRIVY